MAVRSHLEGLWSAELIGSQATVSIGVLVFEPVRVSQDGHEEGRVLGGDRHYAHLGTYRVENGRVAGRLRIVRYDVHEDGAPLFERDETGVELHGAIEPGGHREVLDLELTATEPALPGVTRVRLTLRVAT
ncbi:MAG: hypothetical protein OXU81_18785 [Gammaproteobacteria bacterium]|nr:hypothetical protein [Gammaproteobacteria bacterium]